MCGNSSQSNIWIILEFGLILTLPRFNPQREGGREGGRDRDSYMSNWLHDSGSSWLSCQGGKGKEEGGAWCGVRKLLEELEKKLGEGCWEGECMVLKFHKLLGFPAIICCTGELCKTLLFMPFFFFPWDDHCKGKKRCFPFSFPLSPSFYLFLSYVYGLCS